MEKITKMALLYDFYAQLLTKRQQNFFDLYYGNDYSLGEIAENYNVSRQAVHDTLKRADSMLQYYEKKLGLVEKFMAQRNKLTEVASLLEKNNDPLSKRVARARKILQELLEMDRG